MILKHYLIFFYVRDSIFVVLKYLHSFLSKPLTLKIFLKYRYNDDPIYPDDPVISIFFIKFFVIVFITNNEKITFKF